MSADKYPNIFSRQMATIVYISSHLPDMAGVFAEFDEFGNGRYT